jgi:hypothetical protein
VIADVYWLAFVQYVGDTEARRRDHYKDAEHFIDLITTLNPNLIQAYYFAAFIIGAELHKPDIANSLIERGIRTNQDNWYLPFIAGINQYLYAHNEMAAAKYYRMAAKFPDAPQWLPRQAEILEARIPSIIKEINTWNNIYCSSKDAIVQDRAREHLLSLWMRVYKTAPNAVLKRRAAQQLHNLGLYGL